MEDREDLKDGKYGVFVGGLWQQKSSFVQIQDFDKFLKQSRELTILAIFWANGFLLFYNVISFI